MEPVFIYFNKVKFDNSDLKTFTLKFSHGDLLDGVLFKKTSDYYITSMIGSITIEKDFTELKDYTEVKKVSDIANAYLKNGINHFKSLPQLSSLMFESNETKLLQDESKQALSLVKIPFINLESKKKDIAKIYSGYENLKKYGLTFSNTYLTYSLNFTTENDELYINKTLRLRRSKNLTVGSVFRKTLGKNCFLSKLNGQYVALYLPIAKYHYNRKKEITATQFNQEILTHFFVYQSIFQGLTAYPSHTITFTESQMSQRYPIFWGKSFIKIYPNSELYVTPSLYEKIKTKMTFTSITLTDTESYNLRHKYFWFEKNKKFYKIINTDPKATFTLRADDFTLYNDDVKIITNSTDSIFNFTADFNSSTTKTVKVKSPKDIAAKLQSEQLNFLQSNKINTVNLTYAYEKIFLYDLENMIKSTFTTELQKEFNIYGLIYFSGEQKEKLQLIKPKNKLKFKFDQDIYKKQIKFELAKVHKKKHLTLLAIIYLTLVY